MRRLTMPDPVRPTEAEITSHELPGHQTVQQLRREHSLATTECRTSLSHTTAADMHKVG